LGQAAADYAAQGQEAKPDVHEVRREIEADLKESKRRVVIAIDDIDRLSASEVRDLFRVVKATADFPNTRYLLAFDIRTVTEALSVVQHTDGVAYLEKIVQIPFRLPEPAPGQLMAIVAEGVNEIASQQDEIDDEERKETSEALDLLSFYGLGSLWDNMRRVNRFLDSLRLMLPAVAGEVRLVNFVLLEALRVTEPRAYEGILDGQNPLLGTGTGAEVLLTRGSRDSQEEINRATATLVDAICGATEHTELGGVIRRILEYLFPRVESATGGIGAHGPDRLDEWANTKRVCVEEYFRIATSWSLSPGAITDAEVRDLVNITDPATLRGRLHIYDHDARDGVNFKSVLAKLGPFYRSEADPPALETITRVVLGEERVDRSYGSMLLLAEGALKRMSDPERKRQVLKETIEVHRLLPLTADLLKELGKEHGWFDWEAPPDEYRTLPTAQFNEVVDTALEDLRKQAQETSLLSRRPLSESLYFWRVATIWRAGTDEDEPRAYLEELVEDQDSFVALVRALIGEEAAGRIAKNEALPEESSVVTQLQPLWVFRLDRKARAQAHTLLDENISAEDRALLEWFVRTHESENRRIGDQQSPKVT